MIKNWFDEKKSLTASDKHNYGATIRLNLENGNVGYVQGIFNKEKGEFVDGQRIETKELDDELSKRHQENDVVLYNY
jgi:hypothetical protein